ncbi:NPR2-domain-containing protein [Phanerochaete sordida]|uniref:NPR2-domain-containing protein n=1 Tax=Phanerochaete sordida TaxID=48140 RepID=A0A9P3G9P6_9APHY|nr:NPR2-domain-containing protein [Phanerochaete sordida]
MAESSPSFLPRIESVFYAVFDEHQGPKIVHQVPEGLIAGQHSNFANVFSVPGSLFTTSPTSSTPGPFPSEQSIARVAASVLSSPVLSRLGERPLFPSPQKRGTAAGRILFNFDDVSKYIIPPSALCGRLVKFATRSHRIIGFPVELKGRYRRNYFRYNLCFVFDRNADLSCYEPVVRKVSRVLTSCEEESAFLSGPNSAPAIHAILEQLYEDLNSYSETSIQIDEFNSIDLKIFPFYPNPPPVKDWQVPLALINITRRIEPNWDLTVAKVVQYIDGVNHVARIARLADCDIDLCRQAMAHLLYYQVIMMIDIFQYSNMYTLRKSVQWLADEPHVREECGPYATRPDRDTPDWPKLLHLYSRLKPGITVYEWMEEYGVQDLGIDVRRFTSFGVVKGFLRRVHRWPVLLRPADAPGAPLEKSGLSADMSRTPTRTKSEQNTKHLLHPLEPAAPAEPQKRPSLAETTLEQLRAREAQRQTLPSRRTRGQRSDSIATITVDHFRRHGGAANGAQITPPSPRALVKLSPDLLGGSGELVDSEHSSGGLSVMTVSRPRLSRSPSAPLAPLQAPGPPYPPELLALLDGEHHTDELCTRFEVGLPVLEEWLRIAGGGGDEDFGQVAIIYR